MEIYLHIWIIIANFAIKLENMNTKVCKRCGKELPLEEFYQVPSMKDNLDNTCKNCRRELKGRARTPETLHCPVCNKEFPTEEIIKAHFLQCWKEHNPHHKSKPAPRGKDIEERKINKDILDFFQKGKAQ